MAFGDKKKMYFCPQFVEYVTSQQRIWTLLCITRIQWVTVTFLMCTVLLVVQTQICEQVAPCVIVYFGPPVSEVSRCIPYATEIWQESPHHTFRVTLGSRMGWLCPVPGILSLDGAQMQTCALDLGIYLSSDLYPCRVYNGFSSKEFLFYVYLALSLLFIWFLGSFPLVSCHHNCS